MVAAITVAILGIIKYMNNNSGDNLTVATVNSEPISVREFKRQLAQKSSDIYTYFREKHGVVGDSKDFWTTSYGGEVPIDMARDKTLKECVNVKAQQILAKQNGILNDISYAAFLSDLSKENRRRAKYRSLTKTQIGMI